MHWCRLFSFGNDSKGTNVDGLIEYTKLAAQRELAAEKSIGWYSLLFPTPALGRALYLGWGLALLGQLTGGEAINYYCLQILQSVSITSELQQCLIMLAFSGSQAMCSWFGGNHLDGLGRRPVLFISLQGMCLCLGHTVAAFVCRSCVCCCKCNSVIGSLTYSCRQVWHSAFFCYPGHTIWRKRRPSKYVG